MLVYTMGDEADDILRLFKLSDADAKKYSEVKAKFEQDFIKKRNVIYERAKFNSHKQEEGDLHALAEHCEYKDLHDEMIRDRIVVGLRDASLSEKLQLYSKFTLEKAVTKARQAKTVRQQQSVVRGSEEKPKVQIGAVHREGGRGKVPQDPRWRGAASQMKNSSQLMCYRCGHMPAHDHQQCPVKDAVTSVENEDTSSKCANQPK